jgi:hypothetical protein
MANDALTPEVFARALLIAEGWPEAELPWEWRETLTKVFTARYGSSITAMDYELASAFHPLRTLAASPRTRPVKLSASKFYRAWRRLNSEGLTENTLEGYGKFKRAEAIGLLTAMAPSVPLIISDEMGFARGWLWYGWGVVAVAWFVTVLGLIFYHTGRTAARYYREWWQRRS